MTTCPVCEHSQAQGATCDVCGRQLAQSIEAPVTVQALPELEQTGFAPTGDPGHAADLADLEATRIASGPDLPVERVAELEATRAAPTDAPAAELLADMEPSRIAPEGARTAAPTGAVACRYCKIVQLTGLLCDNCGMRLPRAPAPAVAAKASAGVTDGWTVCSKCHTAARIGRACTVCGSQVKAEE